MNHYEYKSIKALSNLSNAFKAKHIIITNIELLDINFVIELIQLIIIKI